MDQIYRETAKKFNLDEKLLRQAMENPELFEPIKNTPTTSSVGAQKIAKPATEMTEGVAATQDVINKLRQGKMTEGVAVPKGAPSIPPAPKLPKSIQDRIDAQKVEAVINARRGMTESLPKSAFGNEVEDYLKKQSGEMAKAAEKNIVKAGSAGKVLRGLGKVAGPVGAALTAVDMGGALSELRKLGAEKIAEENEVKEMQAPVSQLRKYTPEERLRVKEMLKKLRSEAKLR
jgi:hypothetical protein